MNLRLLSGPELWIVFGVLFLMGCAVLVLLMRDESDVGRMEATRRIIEEDRRTQLDAATETPLEPIRKHALLERRKR